MKKQNSYIIFMFVSLGVLFSTILSGSIVSAQGVGQNGVKQAEVVFPETTKVLSSATTAYLIAISPDKKTYTFSQQTPELEVVSVGDIVLGEQSALTPNGFLRRVTSVTTENGQVRFETAPAALEEAFESAHISISQPLKPSQIQQSIHRRGVSLAQRKGEIFSYPIDNVVIYDADGDEATTADQIRANGMVDLEMDYEFDLDIDDFTLETLTFQVSVTETAELMIESGTVMLSDIGVEIPIAEHTFAPIPIGISGLVIVPKLIVSVGVDGSVQVNMTTGVTQQFTMEGGVTYDGDWHTNLDYSNDFTYIPPEVTGKFSIKGYVDTTLAILINDVVGPTFSIKPYLQLDADPGTNPKWELSGGLDVDVGVLVEIFSFTVVDYETTLLESRRSIAALWVTYLPLIQNPD